MLRVAAQLKLYLIVQNSFFDDEDFNENPIKYYNKPYYMTSQYNRSVYYYMQISENEASHYDSMLFEWEEKKDYYVETKIDYPVVQDLPSNEGNRNAFIGVYIQMDETHKQTIRTVATFFGVISDSGGFMTIVYIVTTVIVTRF